LPCARRRGPPEIEAFDLSHIVQAARMAADGRLPGRLYVQFVFGVKNTMPADERILDIHIETLQRLAPGALWCAAGIGASRIVVNEWAIARGGHIRGDSQSGSRKRASVRTRPPAPAPRGQRCRDKAANVMKTSPKRRSTRAMFRLFLKCGNKGCSRDTGRAGATDPA
jgi:hypothetical protein